MAGKIAEAQAKVEDVGGVFIYANDAKSLAEWYKKKLGIELVHNAAEGNYYHVFMRSKVPGANTVFAIKPAASRLSTERNQFAVNFRINDFDGFIKRLNSEGVSVDRTQDYPSFGRFGWIKDPEGNQVEFWQPAPL
ncbi:MAG: VOC family protein [Elusimicrobia bacterium]|nr:VOC family protein [Elusimicrobiota bacterium]